MHPMENTENLRYPRVACVSYASNSCDHYRHILKINSTGQTPRQTNAGNMVPDIWPYTDKEPIYH